MTTMRKKLIKIGAKVVRHGRYVTFQPAEVAGPRGLLREILRRPTRSGLDAKGCVGQEGEPGLRFTHGAGRRLVRGHFGALILR